MAQLLVSVRSEVEARAALAGGAAIIDVKEPSRGSLGMAPPFVWRQVRKAIPPSVVVSVALGELNERIGPRQVAIPGDCWSGIDYCKIGLARAGPSWSDDWRRLRRVSPAPRDERSGGRRQSPAWVAVLYLDWEESGAPGPDAVIQAAKSIPECEGILFDTYNKSRRSGIEWPWEYWIGRAKESGRFVALAGSLDEEAIRRLRPLEPDIFAVRGAACRDGDRTAPIDPARVARLVEAVCG